MKCVIKNIPPLSFGIAGNRGVGFPLVDYCSIFPPTYIDDDSCYLVREEDGASLIFTESEDDILVACIRPEPETCFLVLQEDRTIALCQQESRASFIYCNEVIVDKCFLVLEDDRTVFLARQEDSNVNFEINCPQECYIVPNNEANNNEISEDDEWFTDQQGQTIATSCTEE
jgi:hypothetical protein